MHRLTRLGAIVFLLSPLNAWAQDPSAIVPGSRVRITEKGQSAPRSGMVVSAGADTVLLGIDSVKTVPIPWEGISRIEVSRGQKGHTGTGVGLGALFGAGMGALIGAAASGSSEDISSEITAAVGAGVGAGIGVLVGAAIGSTVKSEKWEEVPQNRWQVSVWPTGPGSCVLALSVGF
jgi:hypothetical protein